MKVLATACALLVVGLVGNAKAGDVSKSTLDAMGFGNASVMSDDEGLEIRGKGTFASVWGTSTATYWGQNSGSSATNNYKAGSYSHHYGSSLAKGGSGSYAGRTTTFSGSFGNHTFSKSISNLVVSGGTAFAFAK